jgi:hypothetical protein
MIRLGSRALVGGLCTLGLLAGSAALAQDRRPPESGKGVPPGSERAVKAALAAWPGATLEDVVTPSESIGLGGENGAFWSLHLSVDGVRQTVSVASDGVLIRSSKEVAPKDLPTTVGKGMAKVAPNGASKITKLETLGVVRFVALSSPETRYGARVQSAAGTTSVTLASDGTVVESKSVSKPKKAPVVDPNARTTDGPIPEQAAKAVQAMREVFPDLVFDLVEEVPYIDSSTQTIVMLWYEVEFFVGGVKHEFNATPDGIVIDYRKTIPASDLPKAVADAIAKAIPDGRIEEVTKSETRAGPRFVGLDRPIVVYEIQPRGEGDAHVDGIKLRIDGTEVKEPELPDWAKQPSKKEKREGR